jgi:hypothetical protein
MIQKTVFSFGYMLVFILTLYAAGSADEIEALRLKAQQGDPEAQLRLGEKYYGYSSLNRDLNLALNGSERQQSKGMQELKYDSVGIT